MIITIHIHGTGNYKHVSSTVYLFLLSNWGLFSSTFFVSTNYGGMQSTYILMSLPFASATTEAFAFVGNLNPNHYY